MARVSTVIIPGVGRPGCSAEKRAMRTACVVRIREVLADGPMSTFDVKKALGVSSSATYAALNFMHNELREVRRSGQRDEKRAVLWELGEDLTLAAADQQQTRTVPARQVGMWRDNLVAALFGPAQGSAPC